MPFQQTPLLTRTLIVSLLLHAALLLGVKSDLLPDLGAPVAPLQAVLVPAPMPEEKKAQVPVPQVVPAAVAVEQVKQSKPESVPRRKKIERKITVPEKTASLKTQPQPVPVPEPVGSPKDSPPSSTQPETAPATEPGASKPNVTAGSQPAGGVAGAAGQPSSRQENANGDDVRQYKMMLAMWLRRKENKPEYYPALARARGWEGTTRVMLDFQRSLPQPTISVSDSSRRNILDEQAVEWIRQATNAVSVPERLKKQDFRISLEVTFELKE